MYRYVSFVYWVKSFRKRVIILETSFYEACIVRPFKRQQKSVERNKRFLLSDYILFPIATDNRWIAVIVCFLRNIGYPMARDKPMIVTLDSFNEQSDEPLEIGKIRMSVLLTELWFLYCTNH